MRQYKINPKVSVIYTPLYQFSSWLRICCTSAVIFILAGCTSEPQFELLDGSKKHLDDYKGRWLLVNFWAEWCAPCLEEVPELNSLYENKDSLGVDLIAFSYDKVSSDQLKAAQKKWDIQYPMASTEPMPMVPFKRPDKLPAMLFVAPNGEIHGPVYGKQTEQTVEAAISKFSQLDQ
ncbi:TlpA disulfide reductase family protein [Pleionea sp. CnH1-48]|uniref:TlpA family protein disulfide reductase n=1 Tax=Pleionea sp. CnH1-48 TaxID=2954494 RepID=UPI0020968842|nr:TlpA disulfide reductase family protein [Pleionea sp. CnH1-48]